MPDTKNYRTLGEISGLEGMQIQCEPPNANLERFYGTCRTVGTIRPVPVDMKNFLVRGSQLRNAEFCFAVVVYAGDETRLVKNSSKTPLKKSQIEKQINIYLSLIFFLMFNLVVWSWVPAALRAAEGSAAYHFYLQAAEDRDKSEFGRLVTLVILYNNLVPVSLYITLDICKFGQAWFIGRDRNCRAMVKGETVGIGSSIGTSRAIVKGETVDFYSRGGGNANV